MATKHAQGVCRTCQAPVIWAVTEAGRRMPVDAEPVADGNILLADPPSRMQSPVAIVLKAGELDEGRPLEVRIIELVAGGRYVSHFATCPQASKHRRR